MIDNVILREDGRFVIQVGDDHSIHAGDLAKAWLPPYRSPENPTLPPGS